MIITEFMENGSLDTFLKVSPGIVLTLPSRSETQVFNKGHVENDATAVRPLKLLLSFLLTRCLKPFYEKYLKDTRLKTVLPSSYLI